MYVDICYAFIMRLLRCIMHNNKYIIGLIANTEDAKSRSRHRRVRVSRRPGSRWGVEEYVHGCVRCKDVIFWTITLSWAAEQRRLWSVEQSTKWGGVCSITEYFQRKIGQILGPPSLFFGSERVCTETASEQPTGHSGLTLKAEQEDFTVNFQGHHITVQFQ